MPYPDMHYGSDYKYIPMTTFASGTGKEVASDIYVHTIQVVNVVLVGHASANHGWTLIDAGMPKSADDIIRVAEARYGQVPPTAILLTHGHFDHVGAIIELIQHWNVPVYAHIEEMPYLTGQRRYPDPDTAVEGGLVADLSFLFPVEPIQLAHCVLPLPPDASVPGMPGWRYIHTPGHTPGHVSFYRPTDRSLIAGDAFVTVRQDKLFKVITQQPEVSGPPRYLTPDWPTARLSVKKLASLRPRLAVTGHGPAMSGQTLSNGLERLVADFDDVAIPDWGRYVDTADDKASFVEDD